MAHTPDPKRIDKLAALLQQALAVLAELQGTSAEPPLPHGPGSKPLINKAWLTKEESATTHPTNK